MGLALLEERWDLDTKCCLERVCRKLCLPVCPASGLRGPWTLPVALILLVIRPLTTP